MFKQLLYAVLFVALVIGLAYVLANYLPAASNLQPLIDRITALENREIDEPPDLSPYLEALEQRIIELEKTGAVAIPPPMPVELKNDLTEEKALLQTLNCKLLAQSSNMGKLLQELQTLETLVVKLVGEEHQLSKEVNLARRETAAQIPSAIDRLEIVWKLLLAGASSNRLSPD